MKANSSQFSFETLSGFNSTLKKLHHPTLGEFEVLQNSHREKILQTTLPLKNLKHYETINSNNIITLKATNNQENIICEYFDITLQEELQQRIQTNKKYTQQEILHFLQNTSSAIAHLQQYRLVHGAIKCANIVKVGQEYKLLHPALFKELKAPIDEKLHKISLDNNKTIITPDMLRAYHREIIDPVHEDHKDDVYALGLVVLDMMALHMEAPVPILKKLEQISFTYTPRLVRLVKKMLEDVLTLRIDPIACNLYVEKIHLQDKSTKFAQVSSDFMTKSYQSSPKIIQKTDQLLLSNDPNFASLARNFKLSIPATNTNLNFGKHWLDDEIIISQSQRGPYDVKFEYQESERLLESTARDSIVKSNPNIDKGSRHTRHNSAQYSIAPTNVTSLSRIEDGSNSLRIRPSLPANYESPCRVSDEENPTIGKYGGLSSINESLLFSGLPEKGVCAEFEDFEATRRDVMDEDFNDHVKSMTQSLALFLPSKPSTPRLTVIKNKTTLELSKDESTPKFKANLEHFITPIRPTQGSTRLNESSFNNISTNSNSKPTMRKTIFGNNPERLDFQKNIEKLKIETEKAIAAEPSSIKSFKRTSRDDVPTIMLTSEESLGGTQSKKILFRRKGPYTDLKIKTKNETQQQQQPKETLFCEGMCSRACNNNEVQSPTIYVDKNQIKNREIRLTASQEKLLKMIKRKVNKVHDSEEIVSEKQSPPQIYQGNLEAGKKNGYGTLISGSGLIIYEGFWANDKFHGEGTLLNHQPTDSGKQGKNPTLPNRQKGDWIKYAGSFVQDRWEGFGQLFAANGDKYVGQFKNNQAYGQGEFTSQDGRVWKGEWVNNFLLY